MSEEILELINLSISSFIQNEHALLKRNLNEQLLSARLAHYLSLNFNKYDVDAEYNGDINKPNDRKALDIASHEIELIGKKANANDRYKITPDIIIHIRGTNEENLVVIEVKKDVSAELNKKFDLIKLRHLTTNYSGNHYNYKLGIAIVFGTGENAGFLETKYFSNGNEVHAR